MAPAVGVKGDVDLVAVHTHSSHREVVDLARRLEERLNDERRGRGRQQRDDVCPRRPAAVPDAFATGVGSGDAASSATAATLDST